MASRRRRRTFVYKGTKRGGGGVLKALLWQGPTLLNPHFANGTKDQLGSRPFYEPLVRLDYNGDRVPVLAAEIPSRSNGGIAADGRSTTWKLKRGVTWHDGAPFSADDVVFNWQFATDPATGAFTPGAYIGVKAVEKIDSHTVRVVFDKPMPLWDRASTLQLIPKHLFAPYQGARSREAPGNLKPVGTGPYRFIDFKPGDLVRGELNPNYHLPNRPFFDTIEIKGGGDATSAARAVLQTGEFDYAWNVLVEDEVLKRMEASGKGRVLFNPTGTTEFILLNATDPNTEVEGERAHPKSKHPVLSDPAVRQALGAAARSPRHPGVRVRPRRHRHAQHPEQPGAVQQPQPEDRVQHRQGQCAARWRAAGSAAPTACAKRTAASCGCCTRPRSTRCARRCRRSTSRPAPRPASSWS